LFALLRILRTLPLLPAAFSLLAVYVTFHAVTVHVAPHVLRLHLDCAFWLLDRLHLPFAATFAVLRRLRLRWFLPTPFFGLCLHVDAPHRLRSFVSHRSARLDYVRCRLRVRVYSGFVHTFTVRLGSVPSTACRWLRGYTGLFTFIVYVCAVCVHGWTR